MTYIYNKDELYHFGIKGQKWGIRRFQNADGSLTELGKRRLQKKDDKWASKNYSKITIKTQKKIARQLNKYANQLAKDSSSYTSRGKLSSSAINSYNRKMAELMNTAVGDIKSPSGKVVKFVAKRGELGVHMALADQGYNINQLKNGVWASGRVAYKKQELDVNEV